MILTGKNPSIQRKTHPCATQSTMNPMWTDLGLNLDISGERLVTEHLILGVTSDLQRSFPFNHCRSQNNVLAFLSIQLVPHSSTCMQTSQHHPGILIGNQPFRQMQMKYHKLHNGNFLPPAFPIHYSLNILSFDAI